MHQLTAAIANYVLSVAAAATQGEPGSAERERAREIARQDLALLDKAIAKALSPSENP